MHVCVCVFVYICVCHCEYNYIIEMHVRTYMHFNNVVILLQM